MAILAMMFAAASASAECPPAEQAALEKFDHDWGDASQAGDRAALDKMLGADFRDLAPDGGGDKATNIENAVKASAAAKANPNQVKTTSDHYRIQCSSASATITHRNVLELKGADGKEMTGYRRAVHTLEKRDGHWVVVATLASRLSHGDVLRYLELDWAVADVKADASWIEKNYAEDFRGVSSRTGKSSSKADDLADAKAAKAKTATAKISGMEVSMHGDVAVVTGEYHATGTDKEGKAYDRNIAFTDTWRKEDGRWLVWASQGTLITE